MNSNNDDDSLDRSIRERLAVVETKIDLMDRRGSSNFEALSLLVARGRGVLIATATIFGAIAGAVVAWALSWMSK